VPGVSPAAFRLPAGTALRYERPAEQLARFLPSYAVLDSDVGLVDHKVNWMLPGRSQIWIRLTAGPITVAIGKRRYDPLQAAIMYGVTSRAMPVTAQGGITVAIDVSPLGWARFVKEDADKYCDQIVPLVQLLPAEFVHDLAAALHASDRDLAVKQIVDDAFLRFLPAANPHEATIERMLETFADPEVRDLSMATDRIGVSRKALLRLSHRYFGFSPKMIMMRSRFTRVIASMLVQDGPVDHTAVPHGYYNVPHFLRDAGRFLAMTPRRFVLMDMPYTRAALRAHRLVFPPSPADQAGIRSRLPSAASAAKASPIASAIPLG